MRVYRPLRSVWLAWRPPSAVWEAGRSNELEFWRRELQTRIVEMPEYRRRMDPDAEVTDPTLREVLERLDAAVPSVIDVGSGPLTAVEKRYGDKRLDVTAVDPLAGEYCAFMREAGIEPPVWPRDCSGERLLEMFGRERFDIAFSRNALDHAVDPMRVISNMVELIKPGGAVVLEHLRREGERQAYRNLHQWNFDVDDTELMLWRGRGHRQSVTRSLRERAQVRTTAQRGWIVCSITKRAPGRAQAG